MLRLVGAEIGAHVEWIVGTWPGRTGVRLRRAYYGARLGALGPGAEIGPNPRVLGPRRIRIGASFTCWRGCVLAACDDGMIQIGDRVGLNANVYLNACIGGRIVMGSDVLVGPNVVFRTSDHRYSDATIPIARQGHSAGAIVVGDDVWIAANVTLVGGITVGDGAVVAAGAVVVEDVPPYTVVGGVPARVIRHRGERP
jgi:acetyltransferase-like isoleucine patch superfamily enzyme